MRTTLIVLAAAIGGIVVGGVLGVALSVLSVSHASQAVARAAETVGQLQHDADAALASLTQTTLPAADALAGADGLVGGPERAQFAADVGVARIEAAVAAIQGPSIEDVPPATILPSTALVELATDTQRRGQAAERAAALATRTSTDLQSAAGPVFASVAAVADGIEADALQAPNAIVIDFRSAAGAAATLTTLDDATATVLDGYRTAADAVRAAHRDDLAAKSGPLLQRRLEIEAFLRALSGGVLVHVGWEPVVNGYGGSGGMGGLTTWSSASGGQAEITLSDSVAQNWPQSTAKALVAHEAGHAISAKCFSMFDWQSRDANEQFATAWAISQGYTGDGNGAALYGQPTQELIDTAATCR